MAKYASSSGLPSYLSDIAREVEANAREYGLDFFPVLFEVVDYDQMNELAAYGGFPIRYPHWRFGMEYDQLKKSADYGLSRIYEMVINNNPAIAYLLEGNSIVDQKLVMAHVFAHVDFFKNNFYFRATDQGKDPITGEPIRKWVDTMANHGATVRKWVDRIGIEKVEEFIDTCLSIENLIDPNKPFLPQKPKKKEQWDDEADFKAEEIARLRVEHDYMEEYINPREFIEEQRKKIEEEKAKLSKLPPHPERDVIGFLIEHAPLERWERDILTIIRTEVLYFWPQLQTKIMNEGWASYWHSRLMTERLCNNAEIIEYAERHAAVTQMSPTRINPYKLGIELFRHIEERWDKGQFGKEWEECDDLETKKNWNRRTGLGRKKIFQVRALYNDVTFIDEFLTPEFVAEQKLYSFGYNHRSDRLEIDSRQFQKVKEKLLFQLTNGGNPFVYVEDANYGNRGELFLRHDHMGVDLRLDWAKEVLKALTRIWKRPVELQTKVENRLVSLRHDGKEFSQRAIK
ncbi:MAG: SpoVR family protein [Sandaracinaceae bacterium]|nr:SpoVR family protein [Sandaracinaceae bacterium]